jgi:hypothetical protein
VAPRDKEVGVSCGEGVLLDQRTVPDWQRPDTDGRERRGVAMPRGRLHGGVGGALIGGPEHIVSGSCTG